MKRMLWLAGALAALGLLTRMPHPATDVGKLEPVQAVWIGETDGGVLIRTDTGASGFGAGLEAAVGDMKRSTSGEIFLETAEFVVFQPGLMPGPEIYELFRPSCRVCTGEPEDLSAAAAYLTVHKPETTLVQLRAGGNVTQRLITAEGRFLLA